MFVAKISVLSSILFLAIIFALGTVYSLQSDRPASDALIEEISLDTEKILYIPTKYLILNRNKIDSESILIQAWYPGNQPAPDSSSRRLWRAGVWWKNVRVLISNYNTQQSFDNFSISSTEYLDAVHFVDIEYDLLHFTQPIGKIRDKPDVWLQKTGSRVHLFITCSERLIATDKSQCSMYHLNERDFLIKTSFDRRLLHDWCLIRESVDDLIDSFKNPITSRRFFVGTKADSGFACHQEKSDGAN